MRMCPCARALIVDLARAVWRWSLPARMASNADPLEIQGRAKDGLWVAESAGALQGERRTHPLYRKLSSMSGEVNAMSRGQLKQRLRELNMEPKYVS